MLNTHLAARGELLAWRDVNPLDFEADFDAALALYGTAAEHVCARLECTAETLLDGTADSPLPCVRLATHDLDRFKYWIGLPDDYVVSGKALAERTRPAAPCSARHEHPRARLTASERHDLDLAAGCYLFGDSVAVRDYKRAIELRLAPFDLMLYAVDTLVLHPGGRLLVDGPPSVLLARTIELHEGATLDLRTVTRVVTDTFRKICA